MMYRDYYLKFDSEAQANEPNCFYLVQADRVDIEKLQVEIQ